MFSGAGVFGAAPLVGGQVRDRSGTGWGQSPMAWALRESVAETRAGKLRGRVDHGIHVFRGVYYGADTASTRFLPPVPIAPWTGVRDALEFGAVAPQPGSGGRPISENCLHLNVWTPALRDGGKRPVMVWFHGGAYSSGTSNELETDGARLSQRGNVVVVTVNHRLNAFGYLYLAEFGGPDLADSGNAGMLDLVLALQWVRDNITEFGGDPGNVTIFGHSGGGAKCATLMAMPAAKGLFHRVATHSGQQVTASRQTTASKNARALLTALNLSPDRVDVLRTLSMAELVKVSRAPEYLGPVKDLRSLPRDPFDPDAPPLSAHIPMIMGNTHDETRVLIGRGDPSLFSLTWETLQGKLEANSPFMGSLDRADVIAKYREWHPEYTPSDLFFSATTDSRSWRGQVIEADRRAAQPAGSAPTYVFQFDWPTPIDGGKWKAHHGLDVPFIFDNTPITPNQVGTGADAFALSAMMADSWIAFARTGNPNTGGLPAWPAFDLQRRPTMVFNRETTVVDDPRGNERRLFGQVAYVQPGT
jgi:para-nitrobenzyl esterase